MPRILKLSLLVLLIAPLSAASQLRDDEEKATKKQVEAAIKDFKKYYSKPNEHVRKAAVDDLGAMNHEDTLPFLLTALQDKSGLVRERAIRALEKQSTKAALAALTREVNRGRKLEVQLGILEAFKVTKPRVAYDTIIKLARSKKFEVRLVAAELLAVMPSQKGRSEALLLELTEDRQPQIRLVAIDALVKLKHAASVDRCLTLMKDDPDWRVRATAMAALRAYRLKRTIEPLIDAMEREDGRLKDDAHAALVDITDNTYSAKPEVWRRWWNRVKDRWKVPTAAEIKKRKAQLRRARAKYDRTDRDYTPFVGINTKSKRILFVIDISGSMMDKLSFASSDQRRLADFRARYGMYETKIDLAREELINTINKLKSYVKFNIITFNSEVKKWKPKLVSATSGNKGAASKFLSKLDPQFISDEVIKRDVGATNTFGALNLAFGLKSEPQEKPSKNHTVESDTVFFMTDGMPTLGRIQQPDELVRYFRVVNRRAKIVFHTLTFGHGNEALLQPLADESGGRYVVISVD